MDKTHYKASLIGATGLVGSKILNLLLKDPPCTEVRIFSRRKSSIEHPKLIEKIVNFSDMSSWEKEIIGDVLFSALGTTKKIAGTISAQRVVDYEYQFNVARAAKENGINSIVLVSAIMADPDSFFPYSKMKGELERDIENLGFEKTVFLRPSLLDGKRDDERFLESLSLSILRKIPDLPVIKTLRPVKGEQVAKAAVWSIDILDSGVHIINHPEILAL